MLESHFSFVLHNNKLMQTQNDWFTGLFHWTGSIDWLTWLFHWTSSLDWFTGGICRLWYNGCQSQRQSLYPLVRLQCLVDRTRDRLTCSHNSGKNHCCQTPEKAKAQNNILYCHIQLSIVESHFYIYQQHAGKRALIMLL